jgi:hypothetical protein
LFFSDLNPSFCPNPARIHIFSLLLLQLIPYAIPFGLKVTQVAPVNGGTEYREGMGGKSSSGEGFRKRYDTTRQDQDQLNSDF